MKKILIPTILAFTLLINACTPDSNNAVKPGTVTVHFDNKVNNAPIDFGGEKTATNNLGQKFSINRLKYYVHGLTLINDKAEEFKFNEYQLIDEDPTTKKVDVKMQNIPAGNYVKLRYNLGVEKALNLSGAQTGDLNPAKGMYWSWTGYIFFNHEGSFSTSTNPGQNMLLHYGGDKNYVANIEIPISGLNVNGNNPIIDIQLNVEKIYDGIDFNFNNNIMSEKPEEDAALGIIYTNIPKAFTFKGIR